MGSSFKLIFDIFSNVLMSRVFCEKKIKNLTKAHYRKMEMTETSLWIKLMNFSGNLITISIKFIRNRIGESFSFFLCSSIKNG